MKRKKRLDYLLLSILCFLVCLFVLTLQGCGGLSCPRTDTAPERVIDVLLVYDTHETGTREFIDACACQWFEQTGIRLNIAEEMQIESWQESGSDECLDELKALSAGHDFDMVIGVGMSLSSAMTHAAALIVPMPVWMGVIDDNYRYLIRLKMHDCWTMQHELAHAFVLDHDHSTTGLLTPIAWSCLPGVVLNSPCLNEDDFKELQINKFRDFKVMVPQHDGKTDRERFEYIEPQG